MRSPVRAAAQSTCTMAVIGSRLVCSRPRTGVGTTHTVFATARSTCFATPSANFLRTSITVAIDMPDGCVDIIARRSAGFVLLLTLASCSERECRLDGGPILRLHLSTIADAPISTVRISGSFAGDDIPLFGCGADDAVDTKLGPDCHTLWVPLQSLSVSDTVEITIAAEGYDQASVSSSVQSDGCHLLPDQTIDVSLVATIAFVCEAWCNTDIRCTPDVDWNQAECVGFCAADVTATTPDDACDQQYRDLYLCQSRLDCPEYSSGSSGCTDFEDAIDMCEA
jgi:hypothetical protein